MIDSTMLVTLLAPILLLAVVDRVLHWVLVRRRHQLADEPHLPTGGVVTPHAAAAPVEAEVRSDERRVA